MLFLNVPFEEKNLVKELGAKWDPVAKKWYVYNRKDYPKFAKWLLEGEEEKYIICDYYYIVIGCKVCFKCKKETNVITFAVENYLNIIKEGVFNTNKLYDWNIGEICLASELSPLPSGILGYLNQNYNFHMGYSNFAKSSYLANHCSNCGVIQGDYFLHGEIDSPFFIDSIQKAKDITLYKVKLENDVIMDAALSFGPEFQILKKYSKIIELGK